MRRRQLDDGVAVHQAVGVEHQHVVVGAAPALAEVGDVAGLAAPCFPPAAVVDADAVAAGAGAASRRRFSRRARCRGSVVSLSRKTVEGPPAPLGHESSAIASSGGEDAGGILVVGWHQQGRRASTRRDAPRLAARGGAISPREAGDRRSRSRAPIQAKLTAKRTRTSDLDGGHAADRPSTPPSRRSRAAEHRRAPEDEDRRRHGGRLLGRDATPSRRLVEPRQDLHRHRLRVPRGGMPLDAPVGRGPAPLRLPSGSRPSIHPGLGAPGVIGLEPDAELAQPRFSGSRGKVTRQPWVSGLSLTTTSRDLAGRGGHRGARQRAGGRGIGAALREDRSRRAARASGAWTSARPRAVAMTRRRSAAALGSSPQDRR